jgi:hypothetical protein
LSLVPLLANDAIVLWLARIASGGLRTITICTFLPHVPFWAIFAHQTILANLIVVFWREEATFVPQSTLLYALLDLGIVERADLAQALEGHIGGEGRLADNIKVNRVTHG